jgi:hypothetical protein
MKTITGWTANIEEVSNGVFRVILTDEYGRKAEVVGNATDETIEKAISYAFDIEKQVSQNWNLFLFNFCIERITTESIVKKEYNDKTFGSWFIESAENRFLYDGKDEWLIFQTKIDTEWADKIIIKKDELCYFKLFEQIKTFETK